MDESFKRTLQRRTNNIKCWNRESSPALLKTKVKIVRKKAKTISKAIFKSIFSPLLQLMPIGWLSSWYQCNAHSQFTWINGACSYAFLFLFCYEPAHLVKFAWIFRFIANAMNAYWSRQIWAIIFQVETAERTFHKKNLHYNIVGPAKIQSNIRLTVSSCSALAWFSSHSMLSGLSCSMFTSHFNL